MKRVMLLVIAFCLFPLAADSQTSITFPVYMSTLPLAALPLTGAEGLIVQQAGQVSQTPSSTFAKLATQNQVLSGGAVVTSIDLGTPGGGSTVTVNCGLGPLQFFTNNAAFTMDPPANDGGCDLLSTNGAAAGAITFPGTWTVGTTGDALNLVLANKFIIHVERINGIATYQVKALQ